MNCKYFELLCFWFLISFVETNAAGWEKDSLGRIRKVITCKNKELYGCLYADEIEKSTLNAKEAELLLLKGGTEKWKNPILRFQELEAPNCIIRKVLIFAHQIRHNLFTDKRIDVPHKKGMYEDHEVKFIHYKAAPKKVVPTLKCPCEIKENISPDLSSGSSSSSSSEIDPNSGEKEEIDANNAAEEEEDASNINALEENSGEFQESRENFRGENNRNDKGRAAVFADRGSEIDESGDGGLNIPTEPELAVPYSSQVRSSGELENGESGSVYREFDIDEDDPLQTNDDMKTNDVSSMAKSSESNDENIKKGLSSAGGEQTSLFRELPDLSFNSKISVNSEDEGAETKFESAGIESEIFNEDRLEQAEEAGSIRQALGSRNEHEHKGSSSEENELNDHADKITDAPQDSSASVDGAEHEQEYTESGLEPDANEFVHVNDNIMRTDEGLTSENHSDNIKTGLSSEENESKGLPDKIQDGLIDRSQDAPQHSSAASVSTKPEQEYTQTGLEPANGNEFGIQGDLMQNNNRGQVKDADWVPPTPENTSEEDRSKGLLNRIQAEFHPSSKDNGEAEHEMKNTESESEADAENEEVVTQNINASLALKSSEKDDNIKEEPKDRSSGRTIWNNIDGVFSTAEEVPKEEICVDVEKEKSLLFSKGLNGDNSFFVYRRRLLKVIPEKADEIKDQTIDISEKGKDFVEEFNVIAHLVF